MKVLLLAPILIMGIPSTSVASDDISFKVNYKNMSDEFSRSIINANKAKKNNDTDLLCNEISNSACFSELGREIRRRCERAVCPLSLESLVAYLRTV